MDLLKELQGMLSNSDLFSKLGQTVGIDDTAQIGKATQLSIPALLEGLSKNAKTEEGARSLGDALDYHAGKNAFDLDSIDTVDGGKILGHIFGDKMTNVADQLSAKSGLSAAQSGSLLSMLAPILMNLLGKEKQQQNIPSSNLSSLTDGLGKQLLGNSDGKSILGQITGFLDKDKDGDVMDDIKDMFGKFLGGK